MLDEFLPEDDEDIEPDLTWYDIQVFRQIDLQRYNMIVEREVARRFDRMAERVLEALGGNLGRERTKRVLNSVLERVRRAVEEEFADIEAVLDEHRHLWVEREIKTNARIARRLWRDRIKDDLEWIAALAASVYGGRTLKEWIGQGVANAFSRLRATIAQGFVDGLSTDQIARAIRGNQGNAFRDGTVAMLKRHAGLLTRMTMNDAAEVGRAEFAAANQDLFKLWAFIAVLDSLTSATCRDLHGKIYETGQGPKPPRHPNCRSSSLILTTRVVLPDETLRGWLRRQTPRVQRDIIGNQDLANMSDADLRRTLDRPRTIEQIDEREQFSE